MLQAREVERKRKINASVYFCAFKAPSTRNMLSSEYFSMSIILSNETSLIKDSLFKDVIEEEGKEPERMSEQISAESAQVLLGLFWLLLILLMLWGFLWSKNS